MSGPTLLALLDRVVDGREHPLRLRRAWPRGDDRLALEYADATGATTAAQWFRDDGRGRKVAQATPGARWAEPGVVLQPHGSDRRLPDLAALTGEPGAELVVHRPERRAVVRRGSGVYTKVVRAERAQALLDADNRARGTGSIQMAELVGVDLERGRFDWAAAPGRSLHDLLDDPEVGCAALRSAGRGVGSTLRALHSAETPAGVDRHTPAAEIESAARWLRAAARYAALPDGAMRELRIAERLLGSSPVDLCVVHRDLHDKQLLVHDAGVVVLDVDTISLGEPAVDLANLLVHLDLRVLQGVEPSRAAAVGRALIEAYGPSARTTDRMVGYAHATRARLAGVYSFRPRFRAMRELITPG